MKKILKKLRLKVQEALGSHLVRWAVGIVVILFIFLFFLLWLPEWSVRNAKLDPKERIPLVNSIRTTWAQVLGGAALMIGLYFTWRRITIAETTMEITLRGQVTERFTKAIDQLGSEKVQIRLGGIYALETIALDSGTLHYPIVEILTSYIRENSRLKEHSATQLPDDDRRLQPPVDIQAILTVLGRRRVLSADWLDLRGADIRGAFLNFANFDDISFYGAHLDEAAFEESTLKKANFRRAHLTGTQFLNCDLQGAFFEEADLAKAVFYQTSLAGADLRNANLEGVYFDDINLCGANLSGARGVGASQLSRAITNEGTRLPDGLRSADIEAARVRFEDEVT